jgi:hypothetical protein
MTRQSISFSLALLMVVVLAGVQGVAAQDATPTSGTKFAGMGYQELHVVVDDSSVQAPTETKAGLTVVTLENQSSEETSVTIASPKSGETIEQTLIEAATPDPATGFPTVAYEIPLAGGPGALSGQTTEAVVNLPVGDYAIAPSGNQTPVVLHVTAAEGEAAQEPTADLTVEMTEYTFTGLPDQIATGDHLMKVTNTGAQPHFMEFVTLPEGTTTEQLLGFLQSAFSGTPMAGPTPAFDETSFQDVAETGILSASNTFWVPLNLPPGTYGVACFVPDKDTGLPHAGLGMAQVFTVA